MKIKANDTIKVTIGKDKGRVGKVIKTFPKKHQVLVEGVNMFKRHRKAQMGQPGGIIDKPRTLDVAKIALKCPKCNQPARVGYQIDKETKEKKRICRKCKKII